MISRRELIVGTLAASVSYDGPDHASELPCARRHKARVAKPRAGSRRPFRYSFIHFAVDSAGELYIFSKSDGMIRTVVGGANK